MPIKLSRLAAAASLPNLICSYALAQTVVRTHVEDPRPLLIAAIESASGEAHGVLTGRVADAITRTFQASGPLYVDVSTVKRYAQPGCSRLKVTFWQEGVVLPKASAPRTQTLELGINFCRDGLPPKSLA